MDGLGGRDPVKLGSPPEVTRTKFLLLRTSDAIPKPRGEGRTELLGCPAIFEGQFKGSATHGGNQYGRAGLHQRLTFDPLQGRQKIGPELGHLALPLLFHVPRGELPLLLVNPEPQAGQYQTRDGQDQQD
jgi:hypothetical protein